MFIESIVIGIIIGIIFNGRFSNLFSLQIKHWYFIIIGVLIQYMPLMLAAINVDGVAESYFILIGNSILLLSILLNIKIKGMVIILFGGILNLLSYIYSGFNMPVLRSAATNQMIKFISSGKVGNYEIIEELSHWYEYLGKIVKIPDFYFYSKSLSVGDFIMMVGVIILIVFEMKKTYFKRSGKMLKFSYK